MDSRASVLQVGEIAQACLAEGTAGQLLASFSQASYLVTDGGQLFWAAGPGVPMHRRCAMLSRPLGRLAAGRRFHVRDAVLCAGMDVQIEIGNARLWCAEPLHHAASIDQLAARLPAYFSGMQFERAPGFGRLIPEILNLLHLGMVIPPGENADPVLVRARPLVLGMTRACMDNCAEEARRLAAHLIGLGNGLTPSGDDFTGGLLFSLRALEAAYPQSMRPELWNIVDRFSGRTHLISLTLLLDHAEGHGVAPLHRILNGIIAGDPPAEISPSLGQLTCLGHSTGWDLLTGALAGLLAVGAQAVIPASLEALLCAET